MKLLAQVCAALLVVVACNVPGETVYVSATAVEDPCGPDASAGDASDAADDAPADAEDAADGSDAAPEDAEADAVADADTDASDAADGDAAAASVDAADAAPPDTFTIIVLPDTQFYVQNDAIPYFRDQTAWIVAQRAARNIVGVIHNGDVVDDPRDTYANGTPVPSPQWPRADLAMRTLDDADIPYGISVGNHDMQWTTLDGGAQVGSTARYNAWFGPSRYVGRTWYGGGYPAGTTDENWVTFHAGSLEIIVASFQYSVELARPPEVIAWMRSVFLAHPQALGILNTHFLLTTVTGAQHSSAARSLYLAARDLPGVQFMTGGHVSGEARRVDLQPGAGQHSVYSMMADYQSRALGGAGWLRIWTFTRSTGTLHVETYSPSSDTYERDADSEFTLPVSGIAP